MRPRLLFALLMIGMMAVPMMPQTHAASGNYFDHIVILAMENQNYANVLGSGASAGCPSGTAPFLCSMLPQSSTIPNYHSYCSGSGDPACSAGISGCSAACYTAVTSGNTFGVSDGVGKGGVVQTNIFDRLTSAGLTWTEFCESGCPRGPDHSPCLQYADTANSPNCVVLSGNLAGDSQVLSSTSNYVWITPTDSHNMHDNSISSGDSWLQSFLVGSGTLTTPASGSLLASGIFTNPSFHTLLWIWWDEYDPSPNIEYGPMVNKGFISQSNSWDEYSQLKLIENNWALPTLSLDATASSLTDMFGPQALATSFTTTSLNLLVNVPVTFAATTTGGTSPYSISWNFGDGVTAVGASASHVYANQGSFTVTETATDSALPPKTVVNSMTITITLPLPLRTSFSFLPATPAVSSPITFVAQSTGGVLPYSVSWNFGDGITGTGTTTTHNYATPGLYTVIESATDSASPSGSTSATIALNVQGLIPPTLSFLGNQTITTGTWINFTVVGTSNIGGTIALSATNLPQGASFDSSTGNFSWRPSSSQTGSFIFTFTATDSNDPSAPTSKAMQVQVNQASPGGSNGGSGGSGGSANGGCLFCVFPKVSGTVTLLVVGGLLGLVFSLTLVTIRARGQLERTKKRLGV